MKQIPYICLLLLVMLFNRGFSQSGVYTKLNPDSFIRELKRYEAQKLERRQTTLSIQDTVKAELLWNLYLNIDAISQLEKAKEYAAALKSISIALNYQKGIANSITAEALISSAEQDFVKAMNLHKKALVIRQKINDKEGVRWSRYNIGNIYQWQNQYKEAMEVYMKLMKVGELEKDTLLLASCYMCLSGIHGNLGNNTMAAFYCNKSISFNEALHDSLMLCINLMYQINFLCELDSFDTAEKLLLRAQKLVAILNKDPLYTQYYVAAATFYDLKKDYSESIKYYRKAIERDIINGSEFALIYNCMWIADNILDASNSQLVKAGLSEQNRLSEAKKYSLKAHTLSIKNNAPQATAQSSKTLSTIAEKEGSMLEAYNYYKKYCQLMDSIAGAEVKQNINELQIKYETENQEQQIALLKKDNLLQQEEVSRQKTFRNSFIGGLMMTMMIGGVAFSRYKSKQKAHRQLGINLERLKHSQQQLIEQEKLASLGALTAGIAHEIKNPLNFINNFSELNAEIVEDLPAAKNEAEKNRMLQDLKMNFEKITGHGARADSIVKNMLAHSNNEIREKELTNINELCGEYFHISYNSVRVTNPDFKCELASKLDKAVPPIKIITQDFSRVLINLFTNAFYAVNEHKILNPALKSEVTLTTQLENNFITIFIRDNGTGMPDEVREKIFEPFYTTKPAGQGTGLGLSLSFDIIKSHNGKIEVSSKTNEFTQFKITLPTT
jgi:two-component system, NtrC family, sensor kinase